MNSLISTGRFDQCRRDAGTIIFDATYYLPNESKDAFAGFLATHIPETQFFDIDAMSDRVSKLPHMMPTTEAFAEAVSALGVMNTSTIIVYDQRGQFSAARAWWMFTVFGHDNVYVLDGGLPKWIAEGRDTVGGVATPPQSGRFVPKMRTDLLRSRDDVAKNLANRATLLLDARSAARFEGHAAEPRQGVRSGHVPGAISLPFTDLLRADHTMKPVPELRALLTAKGVSPHSEVTTMCGSGITGTIINLALAQAGLPIGALYDGSWSEWGAQTDLPVEVSA